MIMHTLSQKRKVIEPVIMSIKIYNTLTRSKELFTPLEPNHVKMYVCGITSYDFCHIGHARSALAFDMIVRYLRYRGYTVTYIRNFTDIDDKIINRAAEQKTTPEELANRFIDEFYTDMDALSIDRPTMEPRATEHIQEMIGLISELINTGKAYQAGNDVYYSVNSFPEYGKLSGRNPEDMQAGARITINEQKSNPMDFVLWKGSKPGEPTWDSPWGPGRPGWHIECSAMSRKYLGTTFDIHGGGQDLIFPHHENELAQSEGANQKPFVTTWIHHGFVTIRDEKMSKSLGNFLTIREIAKHYHPEVIRFFIFSTHYRNPLDFSETAMQDATAGLDRLYNCVAAIDRLPMEGDPAAPSLIPAKDREKLSSMEERYRQAMDNDFNTAQAQAILFDTAKVFNKIERLLPAQPASEDLRFLRESLGVFKMLAGIMGLLQQDATTYLNCKKASQLEGLDIVEETINALIQERNEARAVRNWARSDQIRDQLLIKNIDLKDGPEGTTWTIRRNQT
jgi:cysteinyl-tRNA synthetase